MAMKTRTSSTSVRLVYDDFEPSTEFSENHEAHFLRILLPGFTRDQMRITFMNFTRMLNVSGERQIESENDKCIRFNQSYPIPQNCEEGKLQANFNQGVLTITMPKKILSQHSPKNEAQQIPSKTEPKPDRKAQEGIHQKAQEKPTAPRLEESKPERVQEKAHQKHAPTQVEEPKPETKKLFQEYRPEKARERSPQKYTPKLEGPMPEKAHDHIPQGSTPRKLEGQKHEETHQEENPFRFRIPRGKEDLIQKLEDNGRGLKALGLKEPTKESRPQKGEEEETEPTHKVIKPQRKATDETEQRLVLKAAPKRPKAEKPEKGAEEIEKEKESNKGEEGKLPRKPEKMFQEKEIRTGKRIEETTEKEKEALFSRKEDIVSTIGKGIRQVSASTSEVVTKVSEGKWKEEDKPMLVNMGAAILVIAALGVYLSYKITSSGST